MDDKDRAASKILSLDYKTAKMQDQAPRHHVFAQHHRSERQHMKIGGGLLAGAPPHLPMQP